MGSKYDRDLCYCYRGGLRDRVAGLGQIKGIRRRRIVETKWNGAEKGWI